MRIPISIKNFERILAVKLYERSFCSIPTVANHSLHNQEENAHKKNLKSTTAHCIQALLNLNYKKALKIVNEHSKLGTRSDLFLSKNYKLLIENGVTLESILKYPQFLALPFLDEIITDLKLFTHPLDRIILLACLPKPHFDRLIKMCRSGDDKIKYVSELFQVPLDIACEMIYKKVFLINKDPAILKDTVELLLDFGIPLQKIVKDAWVLKYSYNLVKDRIKLIQDHYIEIDSPKPWMIKSPIRTVEGYAKRRTDNKEILGDDSLIEYFSKKLECTESQAKYLMARLPALKSKSVKSLSEIINFLYNKGFKPFHIHRVPKILVHSVETTKKRLEQLEQMGVEVNTLSILIKSQKQYCRYIEALKKSKKGSIRENNS